ncbi:MAG: Rnf-Nqr domain containing protein, partial [Coriobacteriia bacterium]|nr:Rnf-Nqr domain containing protein [Coriobacteriia bacterium]
MSEWLAVFRRGLSLDNPLTVLMIGLCATLAVSTKLEGALFMGLAVIFVLTASGLLIATLRSFIPELVRIPVFIVIIASFVTIVDLTMHAFLPEVYTFLGVWIPLIVVNCLILGRAEAFAYHNPPR